MQRTNKIAKASRKEMERVGRSEQVRWVGHSEQLRHQGVSRDTPVKTQCSEPNRSFRKFTKPEPKASAEIQAVAPDCTADTKSEQATFVPAIRWHFTRSSLIHRSKTQLSATALTRYFITQFCQQILTGWISSLKVTKQVLHFRQPLLLTMCFIVIFSP